MSLTLGLNAAISGLMTAQRGLDLVSHNIANVNTEGYTRKLFNPESRVLNGSGVGVQVGAITRRVEDGLVRSLRESKGLYSNIMVQNDYMQRVQDLFGTPADNTSLSHSVAELGNQFELLALEADKAPQALQTVQTGQSVADKLAALSKQLQGLRTDVDQEMASTVNDVNNLLTNIDSLNDKISLAFATGRDTTDLLDKRDSQLTALSQIVDITYYARESGEVAVFTKSGATLVDNKPAILTHPPLSSVQPWDAYGSGSFSGLYVGGTDITNDIRSGSLKGLVELRDHTIPDMQAQVDELAKTMREDINLIHNRGTSYPSLASSYTGSQSFIDVTKQTMDIGTDGDTVIALFNTDGTESASTSLRTLMGTSSFTVQDMSSALQSWLQANGASNASVGFGDTIGGTPTITNPAIAVDTAAGTLTAAGAFGSFSAGMEITLSGGTPYDGTYTVTAATANSLTLDPPPPGVNGVVAATVTGSSPSGAMHIDLNAPGLGLAFRDQVSSVPGADPQDLSISFDADGNGTLEKSAQGFSNFFGLNDFYSNERSNWLWDSAVQPTNFRQIGSMRLSFSSESQGLNFGNVLVQNNDSLAAIADRINNDPVLGLQVNASVVTEGSGQRLRIKNLDGTELAITQIGGVANGIQNLGLVPSASGESSALTVSTHLIDNPDLISRGRIQYSSETGEYFLASGDNEVVSEMANAFNGAHSYDSAGGLSTGNLSFSDYAASIISKAANQANSMETEVTYQANLTEALDVKSSDISDVNLDEELAQLMIFQQSYTAAAKVISTTQEMLDVLNTLIR